MLHEKIPRNCEYAFTCKVH